MISPWKLRLVPASFNGVPFHVEVGAKVGGRRIALHEFPKKDQPYAEDMGRRAKRFTVAGYIIGPNYTFERDDLIEQLEAEGAGELVLPTALGREAQPVNVEHYAVTERRERGGICEVEMSFVEAGDADFAADGVDSPTNVNQAADALTESQTPATEAAPSGFSPTNDQP